MKNEDSTLLIILAAIVALFLLRPHTAGAATVNSAAGVKTPQPVPGTNNTTNVIASATAGVQAARDILDWASKTFGGWGNDEAPANSVEIQGADEGTGE